MLLISLGNLRLYKWWAPDSLTPNVCRLLGADHKSRSSLFLESTDGGGRSVLVGCTGLAVASVDGVISINSTNALSSAASSSSNSGVDAFRS